LKEVSESRGGEESCKRSWIMKGMDRRGLSRRWCDPRECRRSGVDSGRLGRQPKTWGAGGGKNQLVLAARAANQ
jgi:hypothetical protein